MKRLAHWLIASLALAFLLVPPLSAAEQLNPDALTALLTRIGGSGAAERFTTAVDPALAAGGKEVFVITSAQSKPCVKGSTVTAAAAGINYYLNHYASVNLAWNRLTTDLSAVALPVPATEEVHTCSADYRYYLNYCTFSYSMSTWTWERWQREIDWMALHGINMPLQIVGLDAVWYNLLTKKYAYTPDEASAFIAGPCFQAWWGMNNLEGWGGPNPAWWYARQSELAKKILARERELGMQPVLPGYSGMVPSDFAQKTGHTANNQGNWCNFVRPYILDPNSAAFSEMATAYYAELTTLMGTSAYYSMDPFHEGANTQGIDVPSAYKKIAQAMYAANPAAKWVIQFWQWSGAQYNVLSQVDKGRLVVLDLFSDAHTHFGDYQGHDAVWCMLPNFGGRTGFFGRFNTVCQNYFTDCAAHSNIKGIGATPEAIESMPVLYDLLFELPWLSAQPDAKLWMHDYANRRYGAPSEPAAAAWEKLRTSALDCRTSLQGPHEAVVCARPSLTVGAVSSWGGTDIFYDAQEMTAAAHLLLSASLSGENYSYDLTDIARQALTDYAYRLLAAVRAAKNEGNAPAYEARRDAFLQLVLDLDELLSTNSEFMLGRWTTLARGIADEAAGTTEADRRWLELDNARTLITTWGDRAQANGGGLRDYSYREWGGMLRDFYYPRWQKYFAAPEENHDWFAFEWEWAHDPARAYSATPVGSTAEVAQRLLQKYFLALPQQAGSYYADRLMPSDLRTAVQCNAYRGTLHTAPCTLPQGVTAQLAVDLDGDGTYAPSEQVEGTAIQIPADAVTGRVKATLVLSDGTQLTYALTLMDEISAPRVVTVASAAPAEGSAEIVGTGGQTSVNNAEPVALLASPAAGYDFSHWSDAAGATISTANPYTYYGEAAATFTAHFVINKWGAPAEDMTDINDIRSFSQYASTISVEQNGDAHTLLSASACPERLFNTVPQRITAARGSSFEVNWTDAGGLQYTYLSAYIDLNGDGEFTGADELLASRGNHGSTSAAPCAGPLSVTLPFDMPLGITHLRLRFDGAWKPDFDPTTGAYAAKATANRPVYDILVEVTDVAPYACTVSVASANEKQGTVDANGQEATYTYRPDETVILRAYPAAGYRLDHWEDALGRALPKAWMEENKIAFRPYDNTSVRAVFAPAKALSYGDWQFDYEETPLGAYLTAVQAGAGELDIIQGNSLHLPLLGFAPRLFSASPQLTTFTLPGEGVSLDNYLYANFKGGGTENAPIALTAPIPAASDWTLTLCASVADGASFNQWGSALLATGTNALAAGYAGGFQLYLTADGALVAKINSGSETRFATPVGSDFRVTLAKQGERINLTLLVGRNPLETKTFSAEGFADITALCTALPTGIDLTLLHIDKPLPTRNPFATGGGSRLRLLWVCDGGWGSAYFPVAVVAPPASEASCYRVTRVVAAQAETARIAAGEVIPGGTPFIYRLNGDDPCQRFEAVIADAAPADPSASVMQGAFTWLPDTNEPERYVIREPEAGSSLPRFVPDPSGPFAYTAFLPAALCGGASVVTLSGDILTGLSAVSQSTHAEALYDLSGRRVNDKAHGLVITASGKKQMRR